MNRDYPHLRHESASIGTASVCRCGAVSPTLGAEAWGSDCPAALREALAEAEARAERAEAERDATVDEARRLRDLARHQRGPLHDAELITDAEYATLAADAVAVARLRGYDEVRRESRADTDKAVAAALEARAKELDIAADTQDAYAEGPDDAVRVETLRRAASIVRGGR